MGKNMSNKIIILMYHSLYETENELTAISSDDRPYAISVSSFRRHLECIVRQGIPIISPSLLEQKTPENGIQPGILLTFDDGHASNYHYAYPLLREYGIKAIFFVTSDFINSRPGFLTRDMVRELAREGMVIGSHGKTHRFFEDLSPAELEFELHDSQEKIEQLINRPVTMLSFPGGRFHHSQLKIARAIGYQWLFSSRVGVHYSADFKSEIPPVLSRIAVRAGLSDCEFSTLIRAAPLSISKAKIANSIKKLIRRVIGNSFYHAIYQRFSD
jgi:hypothetical protein